MGGAQQRGRFHVDAAFGLLTFTERDQPMTDLILPDVLVPGRTILVGAFIAGGVCCLLSAYVSVSIMNLLFRKKVR